MEMDIEVEGMEELLKAMESLPGLVGQHVQGDGLAAAARIVADQAKIRVPVKTGALRDSIRARKQAARISTVRGPKKVPAGAAAVYAGGRGARQAVMIEYGTPTAAAHPYLEPALLSTGSQQLSAAGQAMQRAYLRLAKQFVSGKTTKTVRRLAAQ